MCPYLSKLEHKCSHVMEEACKVAFGISLDNSNQTKSIAHAYPNIRACSVQECVYHILLGQWFRKTFPGVIFANTNILEEHFRVCLKEK